MPHLVGYALERTGGFGGPTMLIAAILWVAAALVAIIKITLCERLRGARRI